METGTFEAGIAAPALPASDEATGASGAEPAPSAASDRVPDAASGSDAARDDPTVVERATYRRVPDDAERLEVELRYELPSEVDDLEFRIEHRESSALPSSQAGNARERPTVDVVETEGFERVSESAFDWPAPTDGPTLRWDGHTDEPRIVVRHDVTDGEPARYAGGTEDWAVAVRPTTRARWRYSGDAPDFAYEAAVDGEGVAGERMAYLGPSEVYETAVQDERIRLVVPEAADLATPPERVLESLADASDRLRVGERNDEVVAIATPTRRVQWAHRGLSVGSDLRVNDDARVADRVDVWAHEYVHTRQDRSATTAETRWLHEATADYYGATFPLERGDVDFATYRDVLARGAEGEAAETVLAEPDTWESGTQYTNGALAVAAIDRQIREASDGEATFQDVVRTWNRRDRFDGDDFERAVRRAGGTDAAAFASEHVRTDDVPERWNRSTHARTFDVALPDVSVGEPTLSMDEARAVAPFGGLAPAGPSPWGQSTGAVGSDRTLGAEVAVSNDGDASGRYRIRLLVDGASRDVATGVLEPGESRTVELEGELDRTGERTIEIWTPRNRSTHAVAVRERDARLGSGAAVPKARG